MKSGPADARIEDPHLGKDPRLTAKAPEWLERSLKIAEFEGSCIDPSCTTCGMRELRLMLHGLLDVSHEDVPSPTPEEDDEDEEDLIWMMVRDLPGDSVPLQRMRSLCLQLVNIRRQRQEAQNRRRQQVKELEQSLERFWHLRLPYSMERLDDIVEALRHVGLTVNERLLEAVLYELRRGISRGAGSFDDGERLREVHLYGPLRGTYAGEVLDRMRQHS